MPVGKDPQPVNVVGTPEHAAMIAEGRHPGVRDALQWLCFSHLPEGLQWYSRPIYLTAMSLIQVVRTDSPELTTALNKLIESKDSAVRAGIKSDTGRAGSVPRPQTMVTPPVFDRETNTGNPMAVGSEQETSSGTGGFRLIRDNPQA